MITKGTEIKTSEVWKIFESFVIGTDTLFVNQKRKFDQEQRTKDRRQRDTLGNFSSQIAQLQVPKVFKPKLTPNIFLCM